jgi:MFS family permease
MPWFMPEGLVYKPVTYESDQDAGGYYGPRANAFFSRSDIDVPWLLPPLNPIIMGGLGKALGSMERAFIVSDFVFPPAIFLAVYAVFYEMVRRRTAALLFASVFIISPLAALLSPSASFLPRAELLYFSSFEYPKVTFIFYALALLFIFRTLRCGGKKNIIAGGIFFGILFYTYLYDWAYIVVALTLSLVWFALRREWSATKFLAGIIGIGGALSIPYWLNFLSLRRLPHYEDLVFRIGGVEIGRQFRFSSVWKTYARHLAWVGALLVLYRPHVSRQVTFLISLLFTYFVVVNVQVILGFSPQPDHWYRETFLPVLLSLAMICVWVWNHFLSRHITLRVFRPVVFIFLLCFFGYALFGQYTLSKDEVVAWGIDKQYAGAYEWLALHASENATVASVSVETNRELSLFSPRTSFLRSGGITLASHNDLWERALSLAAIWEFSSSTARAFIQNNGLYLFHDYYRSREFDSYFAPVSTRAIPEEEVSRRLASKLLISATPDYLIVGPRDEMTPAPRSFGFLPLVYEAGGVRVYRFTYAQR